MLRKKLAPIHPGKILKDHFFEPRNLTIEKVVQNINVPIYQLEDLIKEKGRIDLDMACRLAYYFKVGTGVFLNIQQIYDWEYWKDKQEEQVKKQVKPYRESK
ncbi:MAG: HigA family addiction module antidote protein [Candidatus Moeniiplasma glomeromycotorum]|nr:HigA family addiction module antidote protein [Candidatus Moeniiplasma glomeromycotorum]MCE8167440.1 HigA family addiction module antidote protein [Candidatus Moeniiplasma glomeromycotorum]MCE8168546.1 HigA family addiction module antidote protein [Candidatus Moeniiplasma glomeromycotorum]